MKALICSQFGLFSVKCDIDYSKQVVVWWIPIALARANGGWYHVAKFPNEASSSSFFQRRQTSSVIFHSTMEIATPLMPKLQFLALYLWDIK
jgi:hypothetical protein